MNTALIAGIFDATEKAADWTPPPGSRIKPSTVKAAAAGTTYAVSKALKARKQRQAQNAS